MADPNTNNVNTATATNTNANNGTQQSGGFKYAMTRSSIIEYATNEAMDTFFNANNISEFNLLAFEDRTLIMKLSDAVKDNINTTLGIENNNIGDRSEHFKKCFEIEPFVAALILMRTGDIRRIVRTGAGKDSDSVTSLVVRNRSGVKIGIWTETAGKAIEPYIRILCGDVSNSRVNDAVSSLAARAETVNECDILNFDDHLVFCNNGVYDEHRRAKGLEPFTAYTDPSYDALYGDVIRLMKLETDYNPNAQNVVIHNDDDGTDWDLLSHIREPFSNDIEAKAWALFQHFAIRRKFPGRSVNLVNAKESESGGTSGGNGKGGLINLLAHMIGDDQVFSKPIEDIQKDFALETLIYCYVWLCNESGATTNSGRAIADISIYKMLCREEVIPITRKHKPSISFVYHGAMAHASNGIIKFAEQDESSFRKILYLRCDKEFAALGRDYIVEDYIKRREVHEFLLKYLLDMPFIDRFPKDMCDALEGTKNEIKAEMNMVFAFLEEVTNEMTSDNRPYFLPGVIVPFAMLYTMFKAWEKDNDFHYVYDQKHFARDVKQWLKNSPVWRETSKSARLTKYDVHPGLVEYAIRYGGGTQASERFKGWLEFNWKFGNGHNYGWCETEYIKDACKVYKDRTAMICAQDYTNPDNEAYKAKRKAEMDAAYLQYLGAIHLYYSIHMNRNEWEDRGYCPEHPGYTREDWTDADGNIFHGATVVTTVGYTDVRIPHFDL